MTIFSGFKLNLVPKYESASMSAKGIRPGDFLAGRVLKVKEGGEALFDLNGKKVWTNVDFPIKEKQVIPLSVVETEPHLKLKLLDQAEKVLSWTHKTDPRPSFPAERAIPTLPTELKMGMDREGWMLNGKPLAPPIQRALDRVLSHFKNLEVEKGASHLSGQLRKYIQNSGLFFEKRLHDKIHALSGSHLKISPRQLQQHADIRNIVGNDIKPSLLILKGVEKERALSFKRGKSIFPEQLRSLINRMLENIRFQQSGSLKTQMGQKIDPQVVYADPRKAGGSEVTRKEATGQLIQQLSPRLRHLLQTGGDRLDGKTHNALLKLLGAFETAIPRENGAKPVMDDSTVRHILNGDVLKHVKRLERFCMHRAPTVQWLDTKVLMDMGKRLSHLRAEIERGPLAGNSPKEGGKSETGQVFVLALPLPEESGTGKLKIYYARKGKEGKKQGFRMSLFLQMQNIGEVRTDFFLLNKELKITFYLDDHGVEKAIRGNADSVKESLAKHFGRVLMDAVVSERKVKDFDLEYLLTDDRRLIDLKA